MLPQFAEQHAAAAVLAATAGRGSGARMPPGLDAPHALGSLPKGARDALLPPQAAAAALAGDLKNDAQTLATGLWGFRTA